jgi:carboxymethylenebutenolidase
MGQWIEIPVSGGVMQGWLVPAASGKGPGIVLLQEIFGVNEGMRAKAEDFAKDGFTVLVPDLFWRMEKRVELGYVDPDRSKAFGLMQKFGQAQGAEDCAEAARALAKRPDCSGQVSFVGFCLGGRMAVLAAERYPETKATVSFYGVGLDNIADKIRAPFQFHVGTEDAHIPAEAIGKVSAAVAGRKDAQVFTYPGAKHGFYNPVRADVFDAKASALAKERALAVLR